MRLFCYYHHKKNKCKGGGEKAKKCQNNLVSHCILGAILLPNGLMVKPHSYNI